MVPGGSINDNYSTWSRSYHSSHMAVFATYICQSCWWQWQCFLGLLLPQNRHISSAMQYRLGAPQNYMTYLATSSTDFWSDNQPSLAPYHDTLHVNSNFCVDHHHWMITYYQQPCCPPHLNQSFSTLMSSSSRKRRGSTPFYRLISSWQTSCKTLLMYSITFVSQHFFVMELLDKRWIMGWIHLKKHAIYSVVFNLHTLQLKGR